MPRLVLLEWAIIFVALVSLWPVVMGYHATWYRVYLVVIMVALLWVTRNRLARTRQAAAEARRRHDEITGRGSRPML